MTVGEWMDIWTEEFLVNVKPRTLESYQDQVRLHIKPAMGAVKLQELKTFQIQRFYNDLSRGKKGKSGLSPKTVKNIHGILHRALGKAVALGYLRVNPCEGTELPRIEKKEIKPLDDAAIMEFLKAIQGNPYEDVFMLTLFTGLRRGEVCGLTWDCVDFQNGTLLIKQQLQKIPGERAAFRLVTTKNSKWRTLTPAASVMEVLRKTKVKQAEKRLFVAPAWEDGNFVFTNDLGHHLSPHTVYHNYKRIVMEIGRPDARFHDLRHSYAVAALKNGDPIKTLQETLGHHSAAFTLDVYGHVTDQMKRESADRMEQFIKSVSGQ
jgi:integrase